MTEVGVVHLVRKANGPAPFARFVASYREHAAGLAHELVLIFKGFHGTAADEEYDRILDGIPHQRFFLPDRGLDIEPYFEAVRRYEYRYFCFLNSFSRLLAPGWLATLHRWAAQPGVGLAGATASYQSFALTNSERATALRQLSLLERVRWRVDHVRSAPTPRAMALRAGSWVLGALGIWRPARHFPPFPNYHVRTNGFMAARETLLRVRTPSMLFKLSAFIFESGHDGLTRQVMRWGLRPLVVDRRGEAYDKESWHLADTFRQARQEQLLIADNQTETYQAAPPEQRAELSRAAWGEYARPA
jgi:hypothetical protein